MIIGCRRFFLFVVFVRPWFSFAGEKTGSLLKELQVVVMKSSLLSFYNIERRVCCIYTFEVDIWDWQQRHEMSSVLTSRSCLLAITEEKRRNLLFWGLRAKPCVDRSIKSPLAIVCNGEIENIRLVARHLVSNPSNSFFPLIPVEFSNSSRVVPHSFVTRQLCLSFKIKMCL
jgi:hypothetical protein